MTESSHTEHDLDQWLATRLATLLDALDTALNLDTGLADAQLPGLQSVLTKSLDEVLDLDTGLRRILPTQQATPPSAPKPPASPSNGTSTGTTLGKFINDFRSLPVHVRLTARAWFPLRQLVTVRSFARLTLLAHDIEYTRDLNRAHDLALDFGRNLALARDLAYARDSNLDRTIDHIVALARDLTQAHDLDIAHSQAHDLDCELNQAVLMTHALTFARALALTYALDRGPAPDLDGDLHIAPDLDIDLDLARALAHHFALALVSKLPPEPANRDRINFIHELIADVDSLEDAMTNMAGIDLTQMDLRGIQLEGLRWTTTTRWPMAQVEQIRQNSVEVQPGIFEVRHRGDTDRTDTSV